MESIRRTSMRIRPRNRAETAPRVAVFTAVDGALLDARTFDAGPSRPAVRRLLAADVPVIPVSVMTLDEIVPIAEDFGLRHAIVFEAGGSIGRWNAGGWAIEPCGAPAEALLDVVLEIEKRSGANLLICSALPECEEARMPGASGEIPCGPRHHSFSEPFAIETGDLGRVTRAAASLGFSMRRGRRFFHLGRACDPGDALTRLRDELQCDVAIAAGCAAVDAEILLRADVPIIVPGPDGDPDPELLAAVPNARVAPAPGPAGWTAAVEDVWRSLAAKKRLYAIP